MDEPARPDPMFGAAMREMSRSHVAEIWRCGTRDEPLSEEDFVFYAVMREHPEYSEIWEHAAELGDRKVQVGGTNPFLHVSLHAVIENQLAKQNPPETSRTLFRLTNQGLSRHDAIHRIAKVVSEMMWETLQKHRPLDLATYQRRLRALKA